MITIRVATENDIAGIQQVAAASWRATYQTIFEPVYIDARINDWYSVENMRRSVNNPQSRFLVAQDAEDSHPIVGFCQVGAGEVGGLLYRLYLLPTHWRRGIGSALLTQAESWLNEQGYQGYGCYVHSQNEIGKAFYLRQAFVHQPDRDEGDEWFLWKLLTNSAD